MGEKCKVPEADRDACKEAVLKNAANSFALKKETSSRSFLQFCDFFSVLLRSAKSIVKKALTTYWKIVQVVLGKTNRDFKFPVDESCASSHHPSTAIISESSLSVSVMASPLSVFGASPISHLTSAGLFRKLEIKIHVCSHAEDFPTAGRVATSLSSTQPLVYPKLPNSAE